jgi:hypothetical protein
MVLKANLFRENDIARVSQVSGWSAAAHHCECPYAEQKNALSRQLSGPFRFDRARKSRSIRRHSQAESGHSHHRKRFPLKA